MNNMKRVLALLLAMCTLLSFLPTMAIAVGEENLDDQLPTTVVYDFAVQDTDLVDTNNKSLGNGLLTNAAVKNAIDAYYATETLNWNFAANNFALLAGEGGTANDASYFGGSSYTWKGLRTGAHINGVYAEGYWVAFHIRVPVAGTYDVTLNYQTRADGAKVGEVYLLPGAQVNVTEIDAALTVDNLEESVDFTSGSWTPADAAAPMGEMLLEQGEYTLVFKAKEKKAGASCAYMFLNNLTINLQQQMEALEEADYDFSQAALVNAIGGNYTNKYFYTLPDATLAEAYADGEINWRIVASNKETFVGETYSQTTSYLGYGNGSNWSGLRLALDATRVDDPTDHDYLTNYWFAFHIKSPGEGDYDVTLNYQTRADANQDVKVYLLPGGMTDPTQIQSAMDSTTSLTTSFDGRTNNDGSLNKTWTFTDASVSLGTLTMAEGEYTLVVHCASQSGNYFFLNGLHMVAHRELPPEETTTSPEETTTTPEETTTVPEDTTAPEATTAPEETTVPEETIPPEYDPADPEGGLRYNFALGGTTLTKEDGSSFAGGRLSTAAEKTAIDNYYADKTLHWKYALDNLESLKTDTNTVADTYYFGCGSYKWTGLRLGVNVKEGEESTYPAGYWVAMTIQSPGKGNYQATLNYQTRADGTEAAEVYLLKGTFADAVALETAMAGKTAVQTVNFKSSSWTMEDNQTDPVMVNLEKGEYTLVFKVTKGTDAGAYCYINELVLLHESKLPAPPAPPQLDTGIYDFVLEDTDLTYSGDKSFAAAVFTNQAVQSAIDKYYKNGDLNWKFHSAYIPKGSTSQGAMFGGTADGKTYSWNGLRFYSMGASTPMWQAFTIQSPGTGTYYPAFNYMKNIAGASVGKIYLLPGDAQDVAKAIASNQAIAEISYDNRTGGNAEAASKIFYNQPLKLTAGEEYILVFTAEEPGVKTGENKFAYIYLNQFILYSEKTLPDPGPNVVTYDFDVTDKANGIYTDGKVEMQNIKSDIANRYAKGKVQWKLEEIASTMTYDVAFVQYAGMTAYANEDDYMAFRCKAPGNGVYTLTMNYATSSNGALGAVYILPGDTENVEFAMDHSNRIKKVAFYNETGEAATKDGSTVTLGTWDFTGYDEFIIVFEAYDNSPYSNFAYMWVSQVIATEGNHTKEESTGRQVNSIMVDSEPVKTYESTQYGTTCVVNGQDYLFVPVEGKKMVIYNLDDMVKVGTVRTPFTVCRGITTDKDGIIWLVGDKPVIFRYDPVTEVGTTSRNFGAQIPQCYGGFSVTAAESGMLYLGTYQVGSVVKYDPATDTFTNLGEFNDDAMYSCGSIIKDNYLYIGITGDRNGDGLRTTEMLKIDITTDKLVDRLDITEQVGPDEVMVRGTGIGGDTLFVGGSTMESFIAIDINTMELKHYEGFRKTIAYCGTEEKNGKIYFEVSGTGLCEYDIATDTITDLKMETSNYPLRCGEHSFVTLDDPLYPGDTIVTYRSEAVILYNPESRRVGYITDIIDEEADGSGMNIVSMAAGPVGYNEVYLGAFNTVNCTAISTKTGEITRVFEATGSQTDAILWYEGVLYTGNYNNGAIVRINPEDEHRNVILLSMNNDIHEQNRVHCLAAGDGMLFAGTMPRTDTYDGALVMINLETLENTFVRNIVEGCSVTGLTYGDGLVFGATSYSGGTGTNGPKNDSISAKIFVYDAAKKEKVGELDPRDFFPGLPKQVPYIDAIAVDPDYENNGRVWAMVSETLFCFTFDETTGKFNVQQVLSYALTDFPGNNNRYARATQILFKDGYLYVAMGNKGGMHTVNLSDFSDHSRLNCETPRCFTIAEDGNLYYSIGTSELKMYPLDVTEEDWLSAEAVDALIKAIGTVTLNSEEAIIAARTAYDALPWKHKALVQSYDILQIAETDLLEAKIASIGEVTKEKQRLIEDLIAQYQAMSAKEQKYVKNYGELVVARKTLQAIIDDEKAAEVQKLIDSIKNMGEITLEKENDIIAIREAYDALTFVQKQLVDATLLLEAEEKIAALRQVYIDRLKELITSIGEVTLEDEAAINEAMDIYQWLHMDEREQVDYVTLLAAEKALVKLQKAAAAEVDALIEAIGDTVDYGSGDAIAAARAAYDALTEGSRQYVKLLSILEEAEALYAELFPLWAIIVIAVVAVAAVGAVVAVLLRKRKKAVIPTE